MGSAGKRDPDDNALRLDHDQLNLAPLNGTARTTGKVSRQQ